MRSHLYVPGDQPARMTGALTRGADALILDLEDSVAPGAKIAAREAVAHFLGQQAAGVGPALWVRINTGGLGLDDIAMIVPEAGAALAGICVPKVDSIRALVTIGRELEIMEAANDREDDPVPICALLETATAILDARDIALHDRIVRLAMGEADLGAELGIDPTPGDGREFLFARSMVVLASAAADIDAPTGPVATDFRDLDALRASTEALRRMGFGGRQAIHPAQIPIINEVFTPTAEEVDRAERVIARYDEAIDNDDGVCVDENGRMVDEAVVRSARNVLVRARPRTS